jgi:hypothetical protein
MTTTWSGCSPGSYRILFDSTMSSTTFDLEISFERNCTGSDTAQQNGKGKGGFSHRG